MFNLIVLFIDLFLHQFIHIHFQLKKDYDLFIHKIIVLEQHFHISPSKFFIKEPKIAILFILFGRVRNRKGKPNLGHPPRVFYFCYPAANLALHFLTGIIEILSSLPSIHKTVQEHYFIYFSEQHHQHLGFLQLRKQ